MRNSLRTGFTLLPLTALLLACGDMQAPDATLEPTLSEARGGPAMAEASGQFIAHLTGDEEVPPVDNQAQGQATFRLSADGSEIRYRLIVANIEDVMMAHIHRAPAGENGPVVVWLYPDAPPPQLIDGRFNGVLATGVITEEDLTGPLGEDGTMEDLVELMRSGEAYVNVHTTANPGGEVRGQIR